MGRFTPSGAEGLAERGQLQLAMYALHLSAGNSIYCKSIKVATIEQYLLAAATFLAQYSGVDYRKDHAHDKHLGHILAPILRDIKKYESVVPIGESLMTPKCTWLPDL